MGVTLSVWIPRELQGYTPWESQVGMFAVAEARVAFRPMFPARKAYSIPDPHTVRMGRRQTVKHVQGCLTKEVEWLSKEKYLLFVP